MGFESGQCHGALASGGQKLVCSSLVLRSIQLGCAVSICVLTSEVEAEFVQEDQLFNRQPLLVRLERRALVRVGLGGALGLFFRDSPNACSPRQRLLRLTVTLTFFALCLRSSPRVASGLAAPKAGNGLSWWADR